MPKADIDDQHPTDVVATEQSQAEQFSADRSSDTRSHTVSRRRRRRKSNAPGEHSRADAPTQSGPRRRRRSKPPALAAIPFLRAALPDSAVLIGAALVGAAMMLGGGGSSAPKSEAILQIMIAALLATACILPRSSSGLGRVPAAAWLATAPLILIVLAQLVPLPPSIWRNLPGRDVERAALDMIGAGSSWMPLSLAPTATFASLLAIACIAAIMLYIARLNLAGRIMVALAITLVALASIALGTLQLAHFGGATWTLYREYTIGTLVGFQANRNAQADVLQIGMLAAASLSQVRFKRPESERIQLPLLFACVAVLIVGVLMTGSRAGIALLPVTLLFALMIAWPQLKHKINGLKWWITGAVASMIIAGFGLTRVTVIQNVIARFGGDTEGRWDFWLDTVYALRKAWPAGTGIGTFSYVYPAVERLELVDQELLTRAHNDWLEWTLEAGLVGWIAIALTLLVIGRSTRLAWRQAAAAQHDPAQRGQILFGIAVLVNESLHALVDYPIRSMSLAALIAVAVAFLTPVSQQSHGTGLEQ